MKKFYFILLITQFIFFSATQPSFSNGSTATNKQLNDPLSKNRASMSLSFTQNQGQWNEKVQFRADAGRAIMWFSSDGAYYQFTRTAETEDSGPINAGNKQPDSYETLLIKASFVGANLNPQMVGVDMIDYKCNYFIGNNPNDWHTDVPNYQAVMYEKIYDGIDLKYYGNGKQMEYDFIVSPGADFSQIKIQYEGAESVTVNTNGELVVTTKWGEVVEQRPVIYQVENNNRKAVIGKYKLNGANSFSFELKDYNKKLPLVIDPILSYSTYYGGTGQDDALGLAVDKSGNAYITGWTRSTDLPDVTGGFQDSLSGTNFDAYVTKINPDGSALVYSTYLGGDNAEAGWGIVVDDSGNVYLTGRARSADFPTTAGVIQPTVNGTVYYDAFVTKLNPSGNGLVFSTLLGGTVGEESYAIAIDSLGNSYITGNTESANFPTTVGAHQTTYIGGGFDSYIAKLNPTATALIYSTFLGGNSVERGWCIDADNSGNAYVTGYTVSTDFPTSVGAFKDTLSGSSDAFVTKLNPDGTALVYSTYLGGVGSETGYGITSDTHGNAYVTGITNGSADFPTTIGAYKTTYDRSIDAFVTKFNSTGETLIFSTYFGGTNTEHSRGIALDKFDNIYIAGHTASGDLPTTVGAFQTVNSGGPYDGFMAKLSYSGSALEYSTYMGGASASESMYGIALDSYANVFFAGTTYSPSFPTTVGSYQPTYNGSNDAFIVKFSDFLIDNIESDIDNLPSDYILSQNYPNPFNPLTKINFTLPQNEYVIIEVFNTLGKSVEVLLNKRMDAGKHLVNFNGQNLSSGLYYYRIIAGEYQEVKKMILLK